MRISAEPSDPGFFFYDQEKTFKVTLDGKPVERVITADSDLGIVILIELDGIWRLKEYHGKVEIVVDD